MVISPKALAVDPRTRRLAARLTKQHARWQKKQPKRGGRVAGWRTLTEQLIEKVPELRGTSYETIRRLHHGEVEWHNLRVPVIQALADIYGVKLATLSPELAARYGPSDQGTPQSGWVTAAEAA